MYINVYIVHEKFSGTNDFILIFQAFMYLILTIWHVAIATSARIGSGSNLRKWLSLKVVKEKIIMTMTTMMITTMKKSIRIRNSNQEIL